MRAFDERFYSGFGAHPRHTAQRDYTCSEALTEAIERAKAAIAAFEAQRGYVPGRARS